MTIERLRITRDQAENIAQKFRSNRNGDFCKVLIQSNSLGFFDIVEDDEQ